MEFSIRECTINDVQAIYELNKSGLGYDYPIDKTKDKISKLLSSDRDKILVAEVENKVAGYIHAVDYDVIYAPHMKNIMGIAVFEQYRKYGIGKALLTEVEKWAKETGSAGVRLCSGESRLGAHEFYRQCGYSSDKKQINFKKHF